MIKRIAQKDILEFNKMFSLMLLSRLSIIQSLDIIKNQIKNKEFKIIIKKIMNDVKSGRSVSTSFSKYPKLFPPIYIANLKVAEETGQIAEVLSEYTLYQENISALKKKIVQGARYPILVIIISLFVILFMVFFLIPTFEGLFINNNESLPFLTQIIVNFSYFIKKNIIFIILSFFSILLLLFNIKRNKLYQEKISLFVLKIPFWSSIYKKNILARFSFSMAILLKNGITLIESLNISKNISQNKIFHSEIDLIIKKIHKGEILSVNSNKSKFFDSTFSRLLTVGEESSELDKVFSLISNYYSKEFDYQIEAITSMIEPLLILFVGLIVSVILISLYLPMFEIVNNFGL